MQALGIAAASALSLGQTIQSILTDEIKTSGDSSKAIAIARSWEGLNNTLSALPNHKKISTSAINIIGIVKLIGKQKLTYQEDPVVLGPSRDHKYIQ